MDYADQIGASSLVTVVETPQFIAQADKLLTTAERDELISYLAANPMAGDLVPGAGGIRKLRWALAGRGKRGGARVIHFFHNLELPVFALTMFAKNERVDISQQERNEFRQLTKILVETYRRPTR
jgi:hypothetical protein